MGHSYNTISNKEYLKRIKIVMPIFEEGKQTKHDVKEMFFLYNDRLTPRKTKMSCGKCVGYVKMRMLQYYKEIC